MSAGRSLDAAEDRFVAGLTRVTVTRLVVVACLVALAFIPAPARAETTTQRLDRVRHEVDAAAQRWFAAQNAATRLDARIAEIERRMSDAQARVASTRQVATERAIILYKSNGAGFTSVFDTEGSSALDVARRAELVGHANARGEQAIDDLTSALTELDSQHRDLEKQRSAQQQVLHDVAQQRDALDAQLASLRAQVQHDARAALTAARTSSERRRAAARIHAFRHVAVAAPDPTSAPTRPVAATDPPPVAPPPVVPSPSPPANTGSVNPHHNDPFLVCTRMRESGGVYTINTGNGYYGAYQFLPSTWDLAASHAGRMDLVGVLPSTASPYDQDEVAWTLYQWQGTGPWGGRC